MIFVTTLHPIRQSKATKILRQPGGPSVALMNRPWDFLLHRRSFDVQTAKQQLRVSKRVGMASWYCSTCSIFGEIGKHKQLMLEHKVLSSVRPASTVCYLPRQHQLPLHQLRCYSSSRAIYKTRHTRNMMDRLYDEQIIKTDNENEIPGVVDYIHTSNTNAPPKWMRDSWKHQFCEMVPIEKDKVTPTATKIVNDYQYNDTPRELRNKNTDSDKDTERSLRQSKRLVPHITRSDDYSNVTREVHQSGGKTFSKTTSVRQNRHGNGTFTSMTITSSRLPHDYRDSDDDEDDDIDLTKYFSDSDDDFFNDSDDEDHPNQKVIDMPTTASSLTKRPLKALPPSTNPITTQRQSSNARPAEDFPPPKASKKTSSSSSWSISLNDADYDDDQADRLRPSQPNTGMKGMEDSMEKSSDDTEDGEICYNWDHETSTMRPIMMIPSKRADVIDTETDEMTNSLNNRTHGRVYHDRSEKRTGDDQEENAESPFISTEDEEDEYSQDTANINKYLQTANSKESLVTGNMENWWDRDEDLVNKAKRKTKLATIRMAQDDPLHKRCKTCPVCKRIFKGHAAMIDHAVNKGNCSKDIDDSIKEQMKAQKIDMKTKRKEKNKRKRNFSMDDLY